MSAGHVKLGTMLGFSHMSALPVEIGEPGNEHLGLAGVLYIYGTYGQQ